MLQVYSRILEANEVAEHARLAQDSSMARQRELEAQLQDVQTRLANVRQVRVRSSLATYYCSRRAGKQTYVPGEVLVHVCVCESMCNGGYVLYSLLPTKMEEAKIGSKHSKGLVICLSDHDQC